MDRDVEGGVDGQIFSKRIEGVIYGLKCLGIYL